MEIGTVGEDGCIRTLAPRRVEQFMEFAADARYVSDYFEQPDDGKAGGIDYLAHSGGSHSGPGATEKIEMGVAAAQRLYQTGRIKVA